MNVYAERLNNVCKALRESPKPREFTMNRYGHSRPVSWVKALWTRDTCGTPACALGHYAYRTDLQDAFILMKGTVYHKRDDGLGSLGDYSHFGVTPREAMELFGGDGCNDAYTPQQAITYIEGFIKRKWPEPTLEEPASQLDPAYDATASSLRPLDAAYQAFKGTLTLEQSEQPEEETVS